MTDHPLLFTPEMALAAWDRNDWVAAYTFERHKCNIGEMP